MNIVKIPSAATLEANGKTLKMDMIRGVENEEAIDGLQLRKETGLINLDPGYGNTGSCVSGVTFLDGEKGVIHHRGYELKDLAANNGVTQAAPRVHP